MWMQPTYTVLGTPGGPRRPSRGVLQKKLRKFFSKIFILLFLIGWAMSEPQPSGNYKWLSHKELRIFETEYQENMGKDIDVMGSTGYIFECDLKIPNHLKPYLADFPPLCEKRLVTNSELSPHTRDLGHTYGLHPGKTKKLIADLSDKKDYPIHFRNLDLMLRLGIKLLKIKSGMSFSQSRFLKKYIDLNTDLRNKSTDAFGKMIFKLLNNS